MKACHKIAFLLILTFFLFAGVSIAQANFMSPVTPDSIDIKRTMVSEYSDSRVMEQQLTFDGKEREFKAPFGNAPMKVSARLSAKGDNILIDSKMSFGNRDLVTSEQWVLRDNGKTLAITQTSNSFRVKRTIPVVFDKE